jgi:hypothetical protein
MDKNKNISNYIKSFIKKNNIPFIDHDNKNLPNFIIALTGQSNAQGLGTSYDINNPFDQPNERIFGWNPNLQKWEIADLRTESLGYSFHTFKQLGTQCSAFHFAKRLIEAYPNIRPGIINIGVSGASIGFWTNWKENDEYYKYTNYKVSFYNIFQDGLKKPQGYIFDIHINNIKKALEILPYINQIVNIIIWHQGEADTEVDFYKKSLKNVIDRYINTLNNLGYYHSSMFGFLAISTTGLLYQKYNKVNDILKNLNNDGLPYTKYVDASDLPVSTKYVLDIFHFDSESQRIIGTRCYEQYKSIFS